MPLTWDIAHVENHKEKCWIPDYEEPEKVRLNPVTKILIFATIGVKMGSITENNWAEFYSRLHFSETFNGSLLYDENGEKNVSPEDVKAHIGLRTNVSSESELAFLKSFKPDLTTFRSYAKKKVE